MIRPLADLDFAFDSAREQFASRAILTALRRDRTDGADRILGVTGRDLFVMRRSTYVEEIDQKDLAPCTRCAEQLAATR